MLNVNVAHAAFTLKVKSVASHVKMLIKRTKPVDDFNLYIQVELIFSCAHAEGGTIAAATAQPSIHTQSSAAEFAEASHVQHNFSKRLADETRLHEWPTVPRL